MAVTKVTGRTKEELKDLREQWQGWDTKQPFEKAYCLAKIPKQPDDYDGPPRFCTLQRSLTEVGDGRTVCYLHGGNGNDITEHGANPEPELANMKHGMNAKLENLIKDFDEKDEALYNWIREEWPEAYDVDLESDPGALYDFHRLAAEIVRAERGRGYLIEEGEVHEKEIRDDEGRIVVNEDGEIETEKSQHYLADMMKSQDKKISDLERELGISRRERLKQDATDSAIESIKSFAEVGSDILARDTKEYDSDDEPWKEDDE